MLHLFILFVAVFSQLGMASSYECFRANTQARSFFIQEARPELIRFFTATDNNGESYRLRCTETSKPECVESVSVNCTYGGNFWLRFNPETLTLQYGGHCYQDSGLSSEPWSTADQCKVAH